MDDCYTRCVFNGQEIKVVTKHLEVIDEKYLDECTKVKEQLYADFLKASSVVKRVASRGGHYYLDVRYPSSAFGIVTSKIFRGNAAVEMEKFFRDAGIEIEVVKDAQGKRTT